MQHWDEEEFIEDGIVAVGGDLHPQRLINAYKKGIFPWYGENDPILWWCPTPRAIMYLDDFHISKNLAKTIKKNIFEIKFNSNFEAVVENCRRMNKGDNQTWISSGIKESYIKLFKLGYAFSVESYYDKKLVGGLYGVQTGKVFCGESMFAKKNDASKVALYYLIEYLKSLNFNFIDCQIQNNHLKSLGAVEINRNDFLALLNKENF